MGFVQFEVAGLARVQGEGVPLPRLDMDRGDAGAAGGEEEEDAGLLVEVVSQDGAGAHPAPGRGLRLEPVDDLQEGAPLVAPREAGLHDPVRHAASQSFGRRRAMKIRITYCIPVRKKRTRLGADLETPFWRSRKTYGTSWTVSPFRRQL